MIRGKLRSTLRRLHLVVALVFGGLFVLSGLSGSVLVWRHELDRLLNPELFEVTPAKADHALRPGAPLSSAIQGSIDRLAADPVYGRPSMLTLPARADEAAVAWYRAARRDQPNRLALDTARQVMIDPTTLQVKGERVWGELGLSRRLLMPSLYHLHRYLLAGEVGKTVIGVSGLALLVMSSIGLVLWWPKSSWSSLRKALTVSYRGSWPRLQVSFHRAAGAAIAPALIVLGFSGWSFNLPQWVAPIVRVFGPVSELDKPVNSPAQGRAHIPAAQAVQLAQDRFPAARVSRVSLPAKPTAPFEIRLRQPGELRQGDGNTRVLIDAYDATILRVRDPLHAARGDHLLNWQFPLHSGEAFGIGGRIAVSVIGVAPAAFLLTGWAMWRRSTRRIPPSTDEWHAKSGKRPLAQENQHGGEMGASNSVSRFVV